MKSYKNIDEYISNFPEDTQKILQKVRKTILKVNPDFAEVISYGIPTFKLNGRNIIHFGGFEKHVGLYPGAEAVEVFKEKLKNYKTSKGTIQFQLDQEIPYDLIEEITKFRISK